MNNIGTLNDYELDKKINKSLTKEEYIFKTIKLLTEAKRKNLITKKEFRKVLNNIALMY